MLSRRKFTIASAAAMAGMGSPALAASQCARSSVRGERKCAVGLAAVPVIKQHCRNWCWAACAEMALKVQGFDVAQTAFVRKVYRNQDACLSANGPLIQQAISGPWVDANGTMFSAQAVPLLDLDSFPPVTNPAPLNALHRELEAGRLVIAGTLGHAICISAMEYTEDANGAKEITAITVRDPWPQSGNRYAMTAQQFYSGRLLMSVRCF